MPKKYNVTNGEYTEVDGLLSNVYDIPTDVVCPSVHSHSWLVDNFPEWSAKGYLYITSDGSLLVHGLDAVSVIGLAAVCITCAITVSRYMHDILHNKPKVDLKKKK